MINYTIDEMMQVACLWCNAEPGQPCKEKNITIVCFHTERKELREKLPILPTTFPKTLDATDKAIIIYFAYVTLCNAVAKKSVEMLGKEHTTEEIQRAFAKAGADAALKEGLLSQNSKQKHKSKKTHRKVTLM